MLRLIQSSISIFKPKLTNLTPTLGLFSNTYTRRNVWIEYVHSTNNEDGTVTYEDPNNAAMRLERAERREGLCNDFKASHKKITHI